MCDLDVISCQKYEAKIHFLILYWIQKKMLILTLLANIKDNI